MKDFDRANSAHGGLNLQPPRFSAEFTDRFDFLFPNLSPNAALDEDLLSLGNEMREPEEPEDDDPINNRRIPSAYTYFGQFIDHDLTFDPLSRLGGPNRVGSLTNFRTPRFDLDSLYGHGPHDQPYMYDGAVFRLGTSGDGKDDLLRIPTAKPKPGDKLAVIGDKRNDENLIVSQIHLSFLKYHNRVVQDLKAIPQIDASVIFDYANQIVRWRYQHVVIFDYLRRLILPEVFDDVLQHGPRFFQTPKGVFLPLEFAVAAFRMGHSMVRLNYTLNPTTDGKELDIFSDDPDKDLRGFRQRPADRTITWTRFLEFDKPDAPTQFSMALDTGLAGFGNALGNLPPDVPEDGKPPFVLAQRNLLRGRHIGRGLPSGQTLARQMGIPPQLIVSGPAMVVARTEKQNNLFVRIPNPQLTAKFQNDTPLWYYILREAEVHGLASDAAHPLGQHGVPRQDTNGGRTLGPLGSRIVAEVFFRLLLEDSESILDECRPSVVPPNVATGRPRAGQFGAVQDNAFTLADLVNYAHDLKRSPLRQANFGAR